MGKPYSEVGMCAYKSYIARVLREIVSGSFFAGACCYGLFLKFSEFSFALVFLAPLIKEKLCSFH